MIVNFISYLDQVSKILSKSLLLFFFLLGTLFFFFGSGWYLLLLSGWLRVVLLLSCQDFVPLFRINVIILLILKQLHLMGVVFLLLVKNAVVRLFPQNIMVSVN
jgi:hypothetical protein